MLIRGARAGSRETRTINALHHTQTKRTGRTRMKILWDCRIAILQRLKRYSIKKSTKGRKCTFQNSKSKRPRQGQREPKSIIKIFMQSDKDKKHIQPYKGAISMNNNIRTAPIASDLCSPRDPPKGGMRAKQTEHRLDFEKTRGGSNC
jgi:hypothetical protein